jgi:uncharacterized protein with NRDE domain
MYRNLKLQRKREKYVSFYLFSDIFLQNMCLIVFAVNVLPGYPFLLAGNRDEFYQRTAKPARRWNTDPVLIAGQDLEAGGTWMGISETGRFAALTNYRAIHEIKENAPSRGNIVKDFLLTDKPVREWLERLLKQSGKYNGFNLLAGSFSELFYLTNKMDTIQKLEPGFYSISNAFLNTPWPKTEKALHHFRSILEKKGVDEEAIFELLIDQEKFPIEQLPETGLTEELEKAVSSVFIQTENYGTRCSTIVSMDSHSNISFAERTYTPGTTQVEFETRFSFSLK